MNKPLQHLFSWTKLHIWASYTKLPALLKMDHPCFLDFFGLNHADDGFRPRGGLFYPFRSADTFAGPRDDFFAGHNVFPLIAIIQIETKEVIAHDIIGNRLESTVIAFTTFYFGFLTKRPDPFVPANRLIAAFPRSFALKSFWKNIFAATEQRPK